MIILIFAVIVICPYLYSMCLVSPVLKSPYFKEHLSVVAFNITYAIWKNVQFLNMTPMKKAWFMAPIEYSSNGKDMVPMKYNLLVYSPNGKGMVLWKVVFGRGNRHGKR